MIAAVILAAGESKRMGQPKMLLPWGNDCVLGHVLSVFQSAGVADICVVTGGSRERVENIVSDKNIRCVYNPEFANEEMLSSIQCGLRSMQAEAQAALIGLGDQPQVQERNVRMVYETFQATLSPIVVPSSWLRRGHPWLLARPLWDEFLALKSPQSARDFLNHHMELINYVNVDDPSILADLDTPADYQKWNQGKL
jgi:molybdenum cofactor cytidylyltransferase